MVDHVGNSNNGNTIKKVAASTSIFKGYKTDLPIYQITRAELAKVCGDAVQNVLDKIKLADDADWGHGFRRSDHLDRLGNLPFPPADGLQYREYHIEKSGLPNPGWARLVFCVAAKRCMFFTPTHYDVWVFDRTVAETLPKTELPPTAAGAQNPFFQLLM